MREVFTSLRLLYRADWISPRMSPCNRAHNAISADDMTCDWIPQALRTTVMRPA